MVGVLLVCMFIMIVMLPVVLLRVGMLLVMVYVDHYAADDCVIAVGVHSYAVVDIAAAGYVGVYDAAGVHC